jgi:hypothetical protein
MNPLAVERAQYWLGAAKEKLQAMEQAGSLDKLERSWSEFLLMANRVHAKLEQGAKANARVRLGTAQRNVIVE